MYIFFFRSVIKCSELSTVHFSPSTVRPPLVHCCSPLSTHIILKSTSVIVVALLRSRKRLITNRSTKYFFFGSLLLFSTRFYCYMLLTFKPHLLFHCISCSCTSTNHIRSIQRRKRSSHIACDNRSVQDQSHRNEMRSWCYHRSEDFGVVEAKCSIHGAKYY